MKIELSKYSEEVQGIVQPLVDAIIEAVDALEHYANGSDNKRARETLLKIKKMAEVGVGKGMLQ